MRSRARVSPDPRHARLTRIFNEQASTAYRTLICCGVPAADAEDGVTKVFEIVLARLEHVRPEAERAFVCGVAARVASNARRALARRVERLFGGEGEAIDEQAPSSPMPAHQTDPEASAVAAAGRRLLRRALEEMSARQRTVFVMCELEGLTAREAARALDIPETAATARRRKARAAFARFCARVQAEEQAALERSGPPGSQPLEPGRG